eukprot:CAMPEP_0201617282 /NCGR_PEP_ID=MMETSP0492-20130828/35917_1 /ASSEMBLY_ACC=CAM_ASM_000837 /TAXON_ID=420259 /ORGANISM="Thalassiosira gravida, Strain GMp14c1" /LENGTH=65 /DNA_ID=CAMNT_0048085485 /DNA_START=769 /DNA_END=967 /DNA_ORIENTATION=+
MMDGGGGGVVEGRDSSGAVYNVEIFNAFFRASPYTPVNDHHFVVQDGELFTAVGTGDGSLGTGGC